MIARPSVIATAPTFQERFEGFTQYPYADVKGLITVGVGCLIDPLTDDVTGLPWAIADVPVDKSEVAIQWSKLKQSGLAGRTAGYQSQFTTIRLSHAAVNDLFDSRMAHFDAFVARRFAWYATAPGDAQLGVLSMAWAMGPAFAFPRWEAYCETGDWSGAATECRIDTTGNPGVAARNSANVVLFGNAASVVKNGWDVEAVHWPIVMS